MITVTKKDLISIGFGPGQSQDIIRMAKYLMVNNGYKYYDNKRLGRVPVHAVEEILGIELNITKKYEAVVNG